MQNYDCIIFDLYNTIIDDTFGIKERERFILDNIYTILDKSLFPVKFNLIEKKYKEMIQYMEDFHKKTRRAFIPFYQVAKLLNLLNIGDNVVFKKVYDCYVDAILQIEPKLVKNVERSLDLLKERNKKIGLISNTGRTPGYVIRMLLKQLNILAYFDDLTFSDEVGFLKPEPVIFELALKKLGADKKNTIFIGDIKTSDYNGAVKAGLNAHLFRREEEDLYQLVVNYTGEY